MEDKNNHSEQDPAEGSRETVERDLERQENAKQPDQQDKNKTDENGRGI